jgi:hypothetical protein
VFSIVAVLDMAVVTPLRRLNDTTRRLDDTTRAVLQEMRAMRDAVLPTPPRPCTAARTTAAPPQEGYRSSRHSEALDGGDLKQRFGVFGEAGFSAWVGVGRDNCYHTIYKPTH